MPVTSAAKLASHIWRGAAQSAANAAHNSANTFRGAFQGASSGSASSTSGSSASGFAAGLSSGGSSAGAGAGGAKFHAGRGAHFSYQHTGRALSQASTTSNTDANNKSNDDDDEIRRQKAYKLRLDGHHYERSMLGATGHLTNSHMQVRFRHAFAAKQGPLLVTAAEHASTTNAEGEADATQAKRQASTSAAASEASNVEVQSSAATIAGTTAHDRLYKDLRSASKRRDAVQVRLSVDAFKALPKEQKTTAGFNMVMESLLSIRKKGQTVQEITDTYNDMIQAGLSPNSRTYTVLVKALCARDAETASPTPAADAPKTSADDKAAVAAAAQVAPEDNFGQALEFMGVAHSSRNWFDDHHAYNAVLSSCALRGDVDRALSVLDLLERSLFANTDAVTFKHLIRTFVTDPQLKPDETQQMQEARKLAACKQVFDEFLLASQNPEWRHDADYIVWSSLIDAHFALNDPTGAVKLFERMLEGGDNVPALQTSVISAMIRGFLDIGDTATALHWFAKVSPKSKASPSSSTLPLPTTQIIEQLIASLARSDEQFLEPLESVFHVYLEQCAIVQVDAKLTPLSQVITANVASAQRLLDAGAAEEANASLDRALTAAGAFFAQEAARVHQLNLSKHVEQTCGVVSAIFQLTDALLTVDRVVDAGSTLTYAGLFVEKLDLTAEPFAFIGHQLSQLGSRFLTTDASATTNPDSTTIRLFASAEFVAPILRAADLLDEHVAAGLASLYRSVHHKSPDAIVNLPLSEDAWSLILEAFCFEEMNVRQLNLEAFKLEGIPIVLQDLDKLPAAAADAETAEDSAVRPPVDTSKAIEVTVSRYGQEALSLLPEWATQNVSAVAAKEEAQEIASARDETSSEADSASLLTTSTPATTPPQQHSPLHRQDLPAPTLSTGSTLPSYSFPPVQVIDTDFGQTLMSLARPSGQNEAPRVYGEVLEQIKVGNFAHPEGLAVLIGAFGRLGDVERVEELYAMAQHVLHALVGDLTWQSNAWFVVEDAMIQALSHAGRPEAATTHRHRIIAAGGTPTSTSYAALIATIRDTTDDASIAQELFDESQRFGVRPSAYLFNTVISKLSRARKADRALQLFDEMTLNLRIKPTSVTYGAVINACTRIGDEQRAVHLFERMERDPAFKPRVPPYNTMMQFFVQSVPDREKALIYYRKMIAARVEPSAHTYKLLLDLFGAIEPVQPQEMEKVFAELVANPSVSVQGTHWASLINCYGCMLNDVDRAIATFDSIASHPSNRTGKDGASLPDAVSFEALLAVFVAHHRTDLMRPHLERMKQAGIQMTAYVVNLLIRGYSMEEGEAGLNEARALFESMSEPAAGVAAVGNHPPRAHGAGAPASADAFAVSPSSSSSAATAATAASVGGAVGGDNPFGSVQREPSTYEAMIRAELSHGHADRAAALVDRMEARAFPPALIIRARALISEDIASTANSAAAATEDVESLRQFGSSRLTFGQTSPRLSHAGLYATPFATTPCSAGNAGSMSVRHASTMAGSGAAAPAPGPPKPNSAFTIFDRSAKTLQKDRAALRPSVTAQDDGSHAFGANSTRGEASRQTDYVRRAMAESLADRVQDIKRDFPTIVELGAGPGFLRHYLDPKGCGTRKIIMCDTSEALLNRDSHLDDQFGFEFERRVVDEEELAFEEGSLDCVVVSGGLHWTNDLPGVLIQIRRALKPDGVFIAALCGGDTLFELRTSLQLAEQEREGGISPRISPMADTRDMASLLSRAGFTIPTVDVDEVSVGYPSMYELMHDLRDMGESNAVINRRGQLRRDTMLAAGAIYEALHGSSGGEEEEQGEGIAATFQLIFLIGWSPAPTQPKPLKRGSAKSSLKDVLAGQEVDVQQQIESDMQKQWMSSMSETTADGNKNKK
ncbi:uncharacterized protein UTRI_06508_B [Ustilago trichophora]|uniref:Pentatricopeptide repeat protein n=1 Tax=Ustilago trichophora TaxID=86804 RepID=A0A5C3ER43_9BASI|nr:uncharacterized protein UTRI_06508_B [Ustilago trichophora]